MLREGIVWEREERGECYSRVYLNQSGSQKVLTRSQTLSSILHATYVFEKITVANKLTARREERRRAERHWSVEEEGAQRRAIGESYLFILPFPLVLNESLNSTKLPTSTEI